MTRCMCLNCGLTREPARLCDECASTALAELLAQRQRAAALELVAAQEADDAAAESACVLEAQREAAELRAGVARLLGLVERLPEGELLRLGLVIELRKLLAGENEASKKGASESADADTLIQGFAPPSPVRS